MQNVSSEAGDTVADVEYGWVTAAKTPHIKKALRLFDADINVVVAIDVAAVVSSDFYRTFQSAFESAMNRDSDMRSLLELKEMCGIDPLREFKSVVIGGVAGADGAIDDERTLLVLQGLTRTRLVQCGEVVTAKEGGAVAEDGNFTRVTDADGDVHWMVWLDNTTVAFSESLDQAALSDRLRGRHDRNGNEDLLDILQKTEQESALWFVMRPENGISVPEGGLSIPDDVAFRALYGWADLSAGVKIHGAARTGGEQQADRLYKFLDEQLRQMRPMADMMGAGKLMDKLELHSMQADVSLSLPFTIEDIQELVKLAGAGG